MIKSIKLIIKSLQSYSIRSLPSSCSALTIFCDDDESKSQSQVTVHCCARAADSKKKQWLDDAVLELVTFNWSLFWSALRLWLSHVGQWSSSLLLIALLCSSDWIGVGTLSKNRNGRRFSSNARRRYNYNLKTF